MIPIFCFLLSLIATSFCQLPKPVNTSPLRPAWVSHRLTVENPVNPPYVYLGTNPPSSINYPALTGFAIGLTGIDPGTYGPVGADGADFPSWIYFLQEAQGINFTSCVTNVTRFTVSATSSVKAFDILMVRPQNVSATQPVPVLIYFHGGAFQFLNAQQFVHWACKISRASGAAVALVDYNVTRVNPVTGVVVSDVYPSASRQAGRAITSILNNAASYGVDATRVFVGGDSAGGHLAASGVLRNMRNGLFVKGLILLCPFLDPSARSVSNTVLGRTGAYTFYRDQVKSAWNVYSNFTQPQDNPFYDVLDVFDSGNVTGLPQSLVVTGEDDPLHDEGKVWSELSNQVGINSIHTSYSGAVHDFFLYDVNNLYSKESKQVIGQIAAFINA